MLPAFYQLILVPVSYKKLPVRSGGHLSRFTVAADEIRFVTIPEFIFTAHDLKLLKYK